MQGMVTEIQRFSIHDGPGIRTTAFLKGCPLSCPWCHNPETLHPQPELLFYPHLCIACGRCIELCPSHHRLDGERFVHIHAECSACVTAADECPTGALRLSGSLRDSDELADALLRDRIFFEETGGGVTISGGEPLAQSAFASSVLSRVKAKGVHTCVDTSFGLDYESVRPLLEVTDLFLVDCKETHPDLHASLTGVSMDRVHANLEQLSRDGGSAWLRCPIIPGVHDRTDHLEAVGALADATPCVEQVWILPYHPTAAHKWRALGRPYRYEELGTPGAELIESWAHVVQSKTEKPVRWSGALTEQPAQSGR